MTSEVATMIRLSKVWPLLLLFVCWSERREADCLSLPITNDSPAGCLIWDSVDLQPGESRIIGCEHCFCSYDGTGYCTREECMDPECVDSVMPPEGCCPQCPNGRNCYLPSGEILPYGETRAYETTVCQCSLDGPKFLNYREALCVPIPAVTTVLPTTTS